MDIKREDDDCKSKPYQKYDDSHYIKQEMKVEEIEMKREVEDNSYNFEQIFIPQSDLETINEDSFNPVTVKKECESEEEASVMYEGTTTEESSRNIIKLENNKHSAAENEYIEHFSEDSYNSLSEDIKNEIDIKEHSLEIKEEYMTKTLDGSTSQAVKDTKEKPKDIVKIYDRKMLFACKKPFACVICKKTFVQRYKLKGHMRFHSGEKPFKCDICQKAYIQKSDLNNHMRIHRGERSFECEVCKKTFSRNGYLTQHQRIHSGEKLYECEICNKKIIQKCNFDVHMRIHSGERPFECEICKERFISNRNLTKHLLIHSGDRPFECEVCKRRFINKSKLNRHMQVHSGERPFECEVCMEKFMDKSKLNKHMQVHAGVNAKYATKGF